MMNQFRLGPAMGHGPATHFNPYIGAHNDRQRLFDIRDRKRHGDGALFDIPLALLWADAACALSPYGTCDPLAPVVDSLWP